MKRKNDGLTPQARYDRKACVGLYLKLNKKKDADILEHLAGIDNRQGYIKRLIRADIARNPETPADE